jgi:glycosyltransferase involved in cell wall biosynthesis
VNSLAILWAQYGPYHFARAAALKRQASPTIVHALESANQSSDYIWNRSGLPIDLITLCPGAVAEKLAFWQVFQRARRTFNELKIKVCLLPSYAPKQSLAALLAARSLGIRTVMMNESHAGTASATGLAVVLKRNLIGWFDAALVGGTPQKRYFASMGIPSEKIFTGYDAVNNDYFAERAAQVRSERSAFINRYDLPDHYFLSLGRLVAKKNLGTLLRAYRRFLDVSPLNRTHLVIVGSGEEETSLKWLGHDLGLPVYNKRGVGVRNAMEVRNAESGGRNGKEAAGKTENGGPGTEIANRKSQIANGKPGVHFYGFRQIEENPVFYGLADAFILPSLMEEWGLVVNEAMASGLPVVVSESAGCAEDLLERGYPHGAGRDEWQRTDLPELPHQCRKNGFVFSPCSSEELSRVLLALEDSPLLRSSMGAESRRIVEKFSCENFARNAMRAIEAAKGERVSARPAAALGDFI